MLRTEWNWTMPNGCFRTDVDYDPSLVLEADLELITRELRDAQFKVHQWEWESQRTNNHYLEISYQAL
jgi:hypothetical protein